MSVLEAAERVRAVVAGERPAEAVEDWTWLPEPLTLTAMREAMPVVKPDKIALSRDQIRCYHNLLTAGRDYYTDRTRFEGIPIMEAP